MERCQAMPFDQKIPPSIFWGSVAGKELSRGGIYKCGRERGYRCTFSRKVGFFRKCGSQRAYGRSRVASACIQRVYYFYYDYKRVTRCPESWPSGCRGNRQSGECAGEARDYLKVGIAEPNWESKGTSATSQFSIG
jgi:hypothetical protein